MTSEKYSTLNKSLIDSICGMLLKTTENFDILVRKNINACHMVFLNIILKKK